MASDRDEPPERMVDAEKSNGLTVARRHHARDWDSAGCRGNTV